MIIMGGVLSFEGIVSATHIVLAPSVCGRRTRAAALGQDLRDSVSLPRDTLESIGVPPDTVMVAE
jgi:hypothetical protein